MAGRIAYTPPERVEIPDRPHIPDKLRAEIHLAAKGRCELCNIKVGKGEYEIDHIEDRFYRGDDRRENLRCLCVACHKDKTRTTAPARAKTRRQADKFGPDSERTVSPAWRGKSRGFGPPVRVPARKAP